ncbi:MAG: hypothetical protein GF353_11500 [Candidatus Lokiarchaeota archaeon]|nr:hypothetical protein [Candidatus Lokiarchaeota archaeon]
MSSSIALHNSSPKNLAKDLSNLCSNRDSIENDFRRHFGKYQIPDKLANRIRWHIFALKLFTCQHVMQHKDLDSLLIHNILTEIEGIFLNKFSNSRSAYSTTKSIIENYKNSLYDKSQDEIVSSIGKSFASYINEPNISNLLCTAGSSIFSASYMKFSELIDRLKYTQEENNNFYDNQFVQYNTKTTIFKKKPIVAAILGFFFGPIGFLYIGWRHAVCTFAIWTIFILVLGIVNMPLPTWITWLINFVFAWKGYTICSVRNELITNQDPSVKALQSFPIAAMAASDLLVGIGQFYAGVLGFFGSLFLFSNREILKGLLVLFLGTPFMVWIAGFIFGIIAMGIDFLFAPGLKNIFDD